MATRGPFVLDGGIWKARNRADRVAPIADTGFTLKVTKPLWFGTGNAGNNVGCFVGIARDTASTVTQAAGKVHENLNITGYLSITQPNQTFRNCRFTYSYTGNEGGGMVYAMSQAGKNTRFEFCEFEPDNPADRYNSVYGHHYTMWRCAISKTVDGTGGYNNNIDPDAVNLGVVQQGCWFGWMAWVADDYGGGRANGHSDGTGTHNDVGIQWGSSKGLVFEGNFVNGAKYNILNPTNCIINPDQSYTLTPGNGVTPLISNPPNSGSTAHYGPWSGQGVLGQHSAYQKIGGGKINGNWFWNLDTGVKFLGTRGSTVKPELIAGVSLVTEIEFQDNVFGGQWRDFGNAGGLHYVPGRWDRNCVINGRRDQSGGVVTQTTPPQISFQDTHNNRWDEDAIVRATYALNGQPIAGQPIWYRVDIGMAEATS